MMSVKSSSKDVSLTTTEDKRTIKYKSGGIALDENKERKRAPETENTEWHGGELKHYVTIAIVVFGTFCCCILFFFLLYRYHGFADYFKKLTTILQPIIVGLVLAYLLNPIVNFQEKYLKRWLPKKIKSEHKVKNLSRAIAIAGALLFLVGIFVLLIAAIVPAIIASIQEIAVTLPSGVNKLLMWVDEFTRGDTEAAAIANQVIEKMSEGMQRFLKNDILSKMQTYVTQITSGVIYGVKFVLNILIGIIVSVYVMASKEVFAGQAKKMIYAMFKPVRANVIVKTIRKSNKIFGGFVSGKLLDSAIIGVLAYIILAIMKMPDTVLVAVIIGVTNVIPFFGPFIGAIPSFLIIVFQDPLKGLYFLIFIIVLQQVDGNIIGPKILGESTGLSSFWVVFAILVFGGVWGFFGMLLGVPITAVIFYIVGEVVEHFLRKRGLAPDTDSYVYLTSVDRETNEMIYGAETAKTEKSNAEKEKDINVTEKKE